MGREFRCYFKKLQNLTKLHETANVQTKAKSQHVYPELPAAPVNVRLLDEQLAARVSDFGFLATVKGDWFSALRFLTAQRHTFHCIYS